MEKFCLIIISLSESISPSTFNSPSPRSSAELRKILRDVAKLPLEEEIKPEQLMEAKVFGR